MKVCRQNEHQTIYEHGQSVQKYFGQLVGLLNEKYESGFKIPEWFFMYSEEIKQNLLSEEIWKQYTLFHDLGKPYCMQKDEAGKAHFPNHSEMSYCVWMACGGSSLIGQLIRRDMEIHLLKDDGVKEFIRDPKIAVTLLIAGLAELHSNAVMFGGIQSDSFKIKWKRIEKRGKAICRELFEINTEREK